MRNVERSTFNLEDETEYVAERRKRKDCGRNQTHDRGRRAAFELEVTVRREAGDRDQ
jgi:hypothetical protein